MFSGYFSDSANQIRNLSTASSTVFPSVECHNTSLGSTARMVYFPEPSFPLSPEYLIPQPHVFWANVLMAFKSFSVR